MSPRHAEIIDAAGQILIPGLWEMHVHLSGLDYGTQAGLRFIAYGVTGLRDMASPLEEVLTLRNRRPTASPSGPRLMQPDRSCRAHCRSSCR